MASKTSSSKTSSSKDESKTKNGPKRKPSDQRENAFNFLAWVVDGATGIAEELRYNDLGLSEEFWTHFYTARKESLLAARSFLDSLIESGESDTVKEEERAKRRKRRGGIDIDF